jgi:hypothetical protein
MSGPYPVYLGIVGLLNNDDEDNFFYHVMIRITCKTILVKHTCFVLSMIVPPYRFQRFQGTDISILDRTFG